MLQLEVNRMQGEMSVERSKMEGLEMALEERRRALEMAEDALQRKREKKKGWKAMQGEGQAQGTARLCAEIAGRQPFCPAGLSIRLPSLPFRGDCAAHTLRARPPSCLPSDGAPLLPPPLTPSGETEAQRAHTQSLLEEKTGAVTRLTERLHLLDIDLAILVADRGR